MRTKNLFIGLAAVVTLDALGVYESRLEPEEEDEYE